MTEESPAQVLDEVARLRRLTRARVHGAAAPLVMFGVLTLVSVFLYEHSFTFRIPEPKLVDGVYAVEFSLGESSGYPGLAGAGDRDPILSLTFWLIAGPLCYLACAWWYQRRARRIGLALRWQPWAYVGAALMAVVVVALFAQQQAGAASWPVVAQFEPGAVLSPLLAIALGLLVLAWVERSWGVAVIAVLYGGLTVVMNGYGLGQIPPWIMPPHGGSHDTFIWPAPNLILLSAVLFVGALVLQLRTAARRRKAHRPASATA